MKVMICVTGMPGAGKTLIAKYISRSLKAPLISMGDVMREEALRRGRPLDLKSMMDFAVEIRKELGRDAVAKLVLKRLERVKNEVIVIDGVRSLDEIGRFARRAKVLVVGVHASPRERFNRLRRRGRKDDPKSWDEFRERDMKELDIGLGRVIALADVMVVNEHYKESIIKSDALHRIRKVLEYVQTED